MNDQQFLLANAYLDGELTDAERAAAEADPTVMAGVEELRALQSRIRDVEPPSAATRDAAIAAALAELRPAAATAATSAATTAPSPVVPFRRRPASARWLAFAAAAVGVGVLGVVVVNGVGSGDDDDIALEVPAEEPAAAEPATGDATRVADEESAVAELATEADTAATDAGAAEPLAEDAAEAPAEEPAAAEPAEARPDIDPDAPVSTPEELGSYGTYLVELLAAGELPPTPETACSTNTSPGIIGRTRYVVDGRPTEVLVEVDDVLGRVVAIVPDTCALLAVGPLYR